MTELLIAVAIIGLLSALTIPAAVQNIKNAQNKSAWRKIFTDYKQTTTMLLNDNMGTLKGAFSSSDDMRDKYLKYMHYVKKCNVSQGAGECWHLANKWSWMNSTKINDSQTGTSRAMLNDGSLVFFRLEGTNCNAALVDPTSNLRCGYMYIDVNGFSSPNIVGKDVFRVFLYEDGLQPSGSLKDGINPATDCTKTGKGESCSALYLYNY